MTLRRRLKALRRRLVAWLARFAIQVASLAPFWLTRWGLPRLLRLFAFVFRGQAMRQLELAYGDTMPANERRRCANEVAWKGLDVVAEQHLHRVRVEGQHVGRQPALCGLAGRSTQHRLVTAVNSVEVANRDQGAARRCPEGARSVDSSSLHGESALLQTRPKGHSGRLEARPHCRLSGRPWACDRGPR